MIGSKYDSVCYRIEQQDEHVPLKNVKTGEVGYSFGCTYEGGTVQVRLASGEFDSWNKDECIELPESVQ